MFYICGIAAGVWVACDACVGDGGRGVDFLGVYRGGDCNIGVYRLFVGAERGGMRVGIGKFRWVFAVPRPKGTEPETRRVG